MKDLDIGHLEGLKKELDSVQGRLSGVAARMQVLNDECAQREKGKRFIVFFATFLMIL